MTADDRVLLEKVLDQNERLLEAVLRMSEAQSPVEIIKALNPVPQFVGRLEVDPLDDDVAHPDVLEDVWADPDVPFEDLLPVDPPGPGLREQEPDDG